MRASANWVRFYDLSKTGLFLSEKSDVRFRTGFFARRESPNHLKTYDFRGRVYQAELGRVLQPNQEEFVAAGESDLRRCFENDPMSKIHATGLSLAHIRNRAIDNEVKDKLLSSERSIVRRKRQCGTNHPNQN